MKMLTLPFLFALAAICTPVRAANVDYAKSEITFVSKQMNVPVQGRFKKFSAQIDFDPKKPANAKAQIEVDLASIDTGSADADAEVGKKAWFNTSAFPAAKFVSSSVTQAGPDKYEAHGKLSIKGIGVEVAAPFVAVPLVDPPPSWSPKSRIMCRTSESASVCVRQKLPATVAFAGWPRL